MPKLPQDRIIALHQAAIDSNLMADATQEALLTGLSRAYRAALPSGGSPDARLMQVLGRLNEDERLRDGTVPLEVWLRNAVARTAELQQGVVFEEALRLLTSPFPR
jgi:hypothetical protein